MTNMPSDLQRLQIIALHAEVKALQTLVSSLREENASLFEKLSDAQKVGP